MRVLSRTHAWIATAATSLVLLLTHLIIPLNIDNDLYQAMGWSLAGRGLLPYVGSWAHTLPGMPYLHALSILVFGNSALGFRVFDILIHVGSALLLFSLGSKFFGRLGGYVAATAATLYYISEGYWLAGQPDGFAVFFILMATWIYVMRSAGDALVVAGFLIGFAGMIRPTYFAFGLSLMAVTVVESRWSSFRIALGILGAVVISLLPYIFVRNGLYEVYEAAIGFNLSVYGDVRTTYDLKNLLGHPLVIAGLAGVLLFVAWPAKNRRGWSKWETLVLLYSISAFVSLYVMGKFLVYHFDPIFAIAAYLAGYAASRLAGLIRIPVLQVVLLLVLGLVAFRRLYPFNLVHIAEAASSSGRPFLTTCYEQIKSDPGFGYATESQLIDYAKRKHPSCLELASITPALLWRSEIPQRTRFTMIHAFAMHEKGRGFTPFQLRCRTEYAQVLSSNPPDLFILATEPHNLSMFAEHSPAEIVREVPGIDSLLRTRYILDTAIGPFACYLLR